VIAKIFEQAAVKLGDKEQVEALHKLVQTAVDGLYGPKPEYLDTMFFPSETNVGKLVEYLGKGRHTLRVCVFNLTNNVLRDALLRAWNDNLDVSIISDDECMKNKGNDI